MRMRLLAVAREDEKPFDQSAATMTGLAHDTDRLHPAKQSQPFSMVTHGSSRVAPNALLTMQFVARPTIVIGQPT
jgi:hypothetical protein